MTTTKDKEFIEKVLFLNTVHTSPENREYELYKICEQYRKDKEDRKNKPKHINACGSCKYFKDAIPINKVWFICKHSPYKKDSIVHRTGDLRDCYASMNKCCYYEREVKE